MTVTTEQPSEAMSPASNALSLASDGTMTSALLPYCDAMFIDNERRSLLSATRLCRELDYGTRVFSYPAAGGLLEYLDNIMRNASEEHLATVAGFAITSASRHPPPQCERNSAQSRRSAQHSLV